MKIVFDYLEKKEEEEEVGKALREHELIFTRGHVDKNNINKIKDVGILSVSINSPITADIIKSFPNLKLITTRSTGFDHIDRETAKKRGVAVSNVPTYGARTVAEFTFALILATSRQAHHAYSRLREEGTTSVSDYEGFDLFRKNIGIIGTGNIGKNVGRIARGFNMDICAYDTYPDEEFSKEIGCQYKELREVVAGADIVSLHLPYMAQTHHIINEEVLSKFKKGSYLINTARGGLINTKALIKFLKNGHIAGAGLDVIEGERELEDELTLLTDNVDDIEKFRELVAAHALIDMPNVIVTPHIAFNTKGAKQEILKTTLDNIDSYINGNPINIVI